MQTIYGHEFTPEGPFDTLADMKRANKRAGGHYWDAAAVEFFDSRDESVHYGRFFIESRQFHGTGGSLPREFVVRVVLDSGAVESLSDLVHDTYYKAWKELFYAMDAEKFGIWSEPIDEVTA